MVLTDEDGMAEALCIISILGAIRRRRINRNPAYRSCCVPPRIWKCPKFGEFHAFFTELSTVLWDPQSLWMFLRMNKEAFEALFIQKCLYQACVCRNILLPLVWLDIWMKNIWYDTFWNRAMLLWSKNNRICFFSSVVYYKK